MNKNVALVILAVMFVLILAGAYLLYDRWSGEVSADQLAAQSAAGNSGEGENELRKAPDFTVYDEDGTAVKLSDFVGKPVVLNFWASWCGPCRGEMPDFQEAFEAQGEQIYFLMVNATGGRETPEAAKSLIADSGYTFPVYFDTDGEAAAVYRIYSLPTTYFIDAEGNLVARAPGAIDGETLQEGINMILPEAG